MNLNIYGIQSLKVASISLAENWFSDARYVDCTVEYECEYVQHCSCDIRKGCNDHLEGNEAKHLIKFKKCHSRILLLLMPFVT